MRAVLKLGCAALTIGIACSACDDSESSVSPNTIEKVKIDTNRKTISITKTLGYEECYTDSARSYFKWGEGQSYTQEYVYKYLNINDTLVMFSIDNNEDSEIDAVPIVMVGGDIKTLEGTWSQIKCDYEDGKLDCNDSKNKPIQTLTISGDTAFIEKSYQAIDNYVSTEFTENLMTTLATGENSLFVKDIANPDAGWIEEKAKEYGIDILEQTSSKMTFTYKGQVFDYKVDKFEFDEDGHEADLYISTNETTCDLHIEYKKINKNLCSENNAQYLNFYNEYKDGKPSNSFVAVNYQKGNLEDFSKCIMKIRPTDGKNK